MQLIKKLGVQIISGMTILICTNSHAQTTINASDFPGKGDTVRYSNSNQFNLDYLTTGANVYWNFADLTANSQTLVKHFDVDEADFFTQSLFGSFVTPTYRASYYLPARELPLATLSGFLNLPIDEIYRFYRKTENQVTAIGLSISTGEFAVAKRADTIEVAYQFPMVYEQSYNSSGYVDLDLSAFAPFALRQYRTRQSEVDGWGTLITPYGSFDCLRIHHIINERDSIYIDLGFGPFWIPIPVPTIHEYEWLTKQQKGPVLKVKANEVLGNQLVNEVMYRDNFRLDLNVSIDEQAISNVKIYPNPVQDVLKIFGVKENSAIKIFNMLGKIIIDEMYIDFMNIKDLESGTYLIQFQTGNGIVKTEKFVKK
jgi:hypothetical protein